MLRRIALLAAVAACLNSFAWSEPSAGAIAPYEVTRSAGDPVPSFSQTTSPSETPVDVRLGPQLFIDDYLIQKSENLIRTTHSPKRYDKNPILGWQQGTTQPYVTVLRDPESGKFRMWYNRGIGKGCAIAYAESENGLEWTTPSLGILGDDNRLIEISSPHQNGYGVSVIDEGEAFSDKQKRFKVAWWGQMKPWPGGDPGLRVAFSPDGIHWTPCADNPVLPDFSEDQFLEDPRRPYGVADIVDVFYDPIRSRYSALVKTPALPIDGMATAPRARTFIRRLVSQTVSGDFVRWERPWRVVVPESRDDGLLEFYSVGGTIARGGLLIGFVRMLHDDFPADEGGEANGIGYTTLVTSRDGKHWERHNDIFFDRDKTPGAWDHAMTWVGSVLPMGDKFYVYYGGYARGHKVEPEKERQIGLAIMPRDRFVSRSARAGTDGRLITVPLTHVREKGPRLFLNVSTGDGAIRVRALDSEGNPINGLDSVIKGDGVDLLVPGLDFSNVDKPIRLGFELDRAELYGFDFGK
jgi:hypothetical protein